MRNGVGPPILVNKAMNWMKNSYFLLVQKRERRLKVMIFLVFPKQEHRKVKKAFILQALSLQVAASSLSGVISTSKQASTNTMRQCHNTNSIPSGG